MRAGEGPGKVATETGQGWIDKTRTAFGKRSVNGIPEWVRSIGNPRMQFKRGAEEYIKIDGKSHVRWYFAPDFITFFLLVHKPGDYQLLHSRLSQSRFINPKGKGGAITFRVYNDRDLQTLKEILLKRVDDGNTSSPNLDRSPEVEQTSRGSVTLVVEQDSLVRNDDSSVALDPVVRRSQPAVDDSVAGDEEGQARLVQHHIHERSPRNRAEAIRIHGTTCKVCGFDFDAVYGEFLARHYIEMHHLRPLSEHPGIGNPATDLVLLCSNYHSMIHRSTDSMLSVEELQAHLRPSTRQGMSNAPDR